MDDASRYEPDKSPPAGKAARSNVYHIHFLDYQLPADDGDKVKFARDYAASLTGASLEDVICFIQQHTGDPSSRVTISIPQRLTEAVRRMEESGLQPVFEEPEKPYIDGDSCVVPGSFQIRHFGVTIDPRSVSNHPQRQSIMSEVLSQHVPELPETAKNFLNWNYIESDEETGLIVIYWGDDSDEEIELYFSNDEFAI